MALTERLQDVEVLIPKVPWNRGRVIVSHRCSSMFIHFLMDFPCIFIYFQVLSEKYGSDLQNDELWEAWIRRYASTIYHPVASCAMHQVVDCDLKVMGLQGLRIADGSVMPDTVSGNTQAPCVMIGEKAAAFITEQHGL